VGGPGVTGLATATVLARHEDWLAAATAAGVTGLLVSPVSWTHHWVWVLPALVLLAQGGRHSRIAAGCARALFATAPLWFTPDHGGPREYGFHWLLTLVANCYLAAGLAFLGYAARRAGRLPGQRAVIPSPVRAAAAARSTTTPARIPAG
jgi:hypothetical protein